MIEISHLLKTLAFSCKNSNFFGLPNWHAYLSHKGGDCAQPAIEKISDVWLIGLALIEMMLRVVILVAIFYVVFGGFKLISARGNADKINSARTTITDALTGMAIAIAATALVAFIAGRFSS